VLVAVVLVEIVQVHIKVDSAAMVAAVLEHELIIVGMVNLVSLTLAAAEAETTEVLVKDIQTQRIRVVMVDLVLLLFVIRLLHLKWELQRQLVVR
jgi:hypothetical protein